MGIRMNKNINIKLPKPGTASFWFLQVFGMSFSNLRLRQQRSQRAAYHAETLTVCTSCKKPPELHKDSLHQVYPMRSAELWAVSRHKALRAKNLVSTRFFTL